MALTNEERLEKLKQHENWWSFSDPQRVFLSHMAAGFNPLEATKKAYPETKNAVVATRGLLARVGVQSALESIGLEATRPNITKPEALKHLSRFMRLAKDATEYTRLLAQYAKLQGWNAEEDNPPDDSVSLDKLVAAMEKKRKRV